MDCSEWTVRISDFGRIGSASIKMAPLVLLVGRNNTGKSYAASLIWALMNSNRTLPRISDQAYLPPPWFRNLFQEETVKSKTGKVVVDAEKGREIQALFNNRLRVEAANFVRHILSFKEMNASKIELELDERVFPVEVSLVAGASGGSAIFSARRHGVSFLELPFSYGETQLSVFASILFDFFVDAIISGARPRDGSVLYIPAARTGLMLAFPSLVSQLIETLGIDARREAKATLPLPVIRFLQALASKTSRENPELIAIASSLEERVLNGNVVASKDEVPSFTYYPTAGNAQLPLHVASSMVTELAPFLILLRAGHGRSGIIFEEPEAHLHISAQRELARALARLVNAKVPVIITTHSDTFVQQLNNLMQLHTRADKELMDRFGYSQEDLIDPKKTRGYEFVADGDKTSVTELKQVSEGFIVPSLNETLLQLAEETMSVQSDDEDSLARHDLEREAQSR